MPKNASKPKSEYAIQTVANALRMLEAFNDEAEIGVSDLARRLDLHKNNAFRLLATLEIAGYIEQDPSTELYQLGPRCLELGHAFARSHSLMQQARPILEALAAATGETVHLGILSGDEVVHLDGVLPDQRVLCATRVGERADAHCTALGKALLAGRIDDRTVEAGGAQEGAGSERVDASWSSSVPTGLQRPPRDGKLARHTDATVEDPSKLAEELRTVGLRGYSTDLEEYSRGLHCVAASVRDNRGRVVAALSLSGPSFRLGEAELHGSAARAISEAASRLSICLGSTL